ncbi:MAG: FliM/FliN family flagellar motor switch protein [Acidobacteria bacterium]|nr:FliM/FliN family flagellar motor switch protein [Acidobacteriota bacterium]
MSEATSQIALIGNAASAASATLINQPGWPTVRDISGRIRVQLRMPAMRLRDALALQPGQMLISNHAETLDVPLCIGGVQFCWCEFSAVDERMGVRITQLA